MELDLLQELSLRAETKIVLLVMDGLGGLPHPETGRTELEEARAPNLASLARRGNLGLSLPVAPGITPGSGPGHLALFGYDPLRYLVGRGILEALGIDFPLAEGDVAARGNFCTLDSQGLVADRRAGRISSEDCARLCARLRDMDLPGAVALVEPVREHRFLLVLRGQGLSDRLSETDPQREGLAPLPVLPLAPAAAATARAANAFIREARRRLADSHPADSHPANMLLLRGFAQRPSLPQMSEVFKLKAAAIAVYPMYRGVARLVGMTALPTGESFPEELATLRQHYAAFDFFFVHYKKTDTAGEDGDFQRKVAAIEELDAALPALLELNPDVLLVTGDHSTPAVYASHSWHPVPFLLYSRWCRPDGLERFDEAHCRRGSLGTFPAVQAMALALAHAGRLARYGA